MGYLIAFAAGAAFHKWGWPRVAASKTATDVVAWLRERGFPIG